MIPAEHISQNSKCTSLSLLVVVVVLEAVAP